MTEAPRKLRRVRTGQQEVEYTDSADQRKEDARQAERNGLKSNRSLAGFLRIFGINLEDRPQ